MDMDSTNRTADTTHRPAAAPASDATVRVGTPQAAAVAGDTTIRPSSTVRPDAVTMAGSSGLTGEFLLKGRQYRGVKILSDNSGEAQVFLVDGEEGRMVLKVYLLNNVWYEPHPLKAIWLQPES